MRDVEEEQAVIDRLVQWAEKHESIRAMLLYSSRANPNAPVDMFSDYDVLLAVTGVRPFHEDDRWLEEFGKVLVVLRNPIDFEHGFECFGFVTHYEEGVKIDYGFYPVEFLTWAAKEPRLPDDLDNGYVVLLDKDHLTDGLKPPSYAAYLPAPPTEQEYRAVIEEFLNDSLYVAKNLWRDNLFQMKYCLDYIMKFQCLRKMLEWQVEVDRNWSIRLGAYGKGLKKHSQPDIWAELESTYVGAGTEENWDALFKTAGLFRRVATDVAEALGYEYPHDLDENVMSHLYRVKNLECQMVGCVGGGDDDLSRTR
jgi:aminoglycoside 6-adenylyltransferase